MKSLYNIILDNYLFVYEKCFKIVLKRKNKILIDYHIKFQSENFEKSHLPETFDVPAGC